MKKTTSFVVFVILIFLVASVLNLLYIAGLVGFRWVSAGIFTITISTVVNLIVYGKEGGPFYYKNWKKHPKNAILFCVCLSVLTVTFIIALIRAFSG